ncbi:hypothetical protein MASR1M8_16030 [Thermomonas brevis]
MSIADDRKRYEQAREQGRQAFRNGAKEDRCPYRRGTSDLYREAWMLGFQSEKDSRGRK